MTVTIILIAIVATMMQSKRQKATETKESQKEQETTKESQREPPTAPEKPHVNNTLPMTVTIIMIQIAENNAANGSGK